LIRDNDLEVDIGLDDDLDAYSRYRSDEIMVELGDRLKAYLDYAGVDYGEFFDELASIMHGYAQRKLGI